MPSVRPPPTSLTTSIARKTSSGEAFRLFAATTAGSAVSIPNAATSPGVWPSTIAASAARAASSCRAMVPGLTLSMWRVSRSGAPARTAAKSAAIRSGSGTGSAPGRAPYARRSGCLPSRKWRAPWAARAPTSSPTAPVDRYRGGP